MADTTTSRYAFTKPGNLDAAGAGLWGPKLNTDFDNIDSEIAFPRLPASSPVYNGGGTTTCDLSLGRLFIFTVAGSATTVAFSNVPAVGSSAFSTRIRILITNGGLFPPTWPASVTWLSTQPTFKAAGVDEVELLTKDGGTTWYGNIRGYAPVLRNTTTVGTGAATIETTLHTLAVPAGVMGLNGAIRITCLYAITGANNNKTLKVIYGGTTFGLVTCGAAQTASGSLEVVIANVNATNVQYADGFANGAGGVLIGTGGFAGAVNSAVAQNVTITGTTPNAGDEVIAKATLVAIIL